MMNETITINKPSLAAVVALIGIIAFAGGWYSSYNGFSSDIATMHRLISDLKMTNGEVRTRIDTNTALDNENRLVMSNKLVGIEADVRYMKQDLSEIKLILVPKK